MNKREIDDSIYALDLSSNTWTKMKVSMPHASCAHTLTMLNSHTLLIYGGAMDKLPFYDDLLLYDLSTQKWRAIDYKLLKSIRTIGGSGDFEKRERLQSMSGLLQESKVVVIYGGSSLEVDHCETTLVDVSELMDPANSMEVDQII